ncbi:helix-turn-helix domain-containing protein [Shimia sp. SDUM112013]|uniref:helix-turn-helix domain-containing protein n=1 Tax=Shimia sp. SDUM112013 TaxID=3136160 RepID=UPI0032F05F2C
MTQKLLYASGEKFYQLCRVLKIDPVRVLRRAGLPADHIEHEGKGSTAEQFFAIFQAVFDEAKRDDLPLFLGKFYAHGPFVPPVFAFSCSPDIESGVKRMALFKPLIAPCKLEVLRAGDTVSLTFQSSDPTVEMPAQMALFELVYFLECSRTFTAEHIIPRDITLPVGARMTPDLFDYFGVTPSGTGIAAIHLSDEDATRPLISQNAELLAGFERDLKRQLAEKLPDTPTTDRLRKTLFEMLPAGDSSVNAACKRLCMSRRSLQRKLKDEATTFQAVLDEVRSELSLHYLRQDDMSIEEISYLLAYRDPNSFYRAFHGWTGMTPMQARLTPAH